MAEAVYVVLAEKGRKFLSLELAGKRFGLDELKVREIMGMVKVTEVSRRRISSAELSIFE